MKQFIQEGKMTHWSISEAYDQNAKLLALIVDMAKARGASDAQISLAWMMNKKTYIVSIPGSRKLERMKENFDASIILLTKEEVANLYEAVAKSDMSAVFGGSKVKK
jgi:aryl-alcohol dehydrogenase-like predicted oxidoreductase